MCGSVKKKKNNDKCNSQQIGNEHILFRDETIKYEVRKSAVSDSEKNRRYTEKQWGLYVHNHASSSVVYLNNIKPLLHKKQLILQKGWKNY